MFKLLKMATSTRTSFLALLYVIGSYQWQGNNRLYVLYYDARSSRIQIEYFVLLILSFISEYSNRIDSEHHLVSMPW